MHPAEVRTQNTAPDATNIESGKAKREYALSMRAFERIVNMMNRKIEDLLLEIGVPASLKGFGYLREAIKLTAEDSKIINQVTKRLYPTIALQSGTTASRAERAIRHSIEVAWLRGDTDTLKRYFGNAVSCGTGKPTNSEFIATVTIYIRRTAETVE